MHCTLRAAFPVKWTLIVGRRGHRPPGDTTSLLTPESTVHLFASSCGRRRGLSSFLLLSPSAARLTGHNQGLGTRIAVPRVPRTPPPAASRHTLSWALCNRLLCHLSLLYSLLTPQPHARPSLGNIHPPGFSKTTQPLFPPLPPLPSPAFPYTAHHFSHSRPVL